MTKTTPPSSTPSSPTRHDFVFTGDATEYFKIWIVNIFLTIITLGIYSAWATVRTNRYFYGHTSVASTAFEYLATPMAILKGRIISVIIFGIYFVMAEVLGNAIFIGIFWLLFILALPWIIMRSLAFRARNTSWRHIRLHYKATYWHALIAFFLFPLGNIFVAAILTPYVTRYQKQFIFNNLRFGKTAFHTDPDVGEMYKVFGFMILISIGLYIGVIIIAIPGFMIHPLVAVVLIYLYLIPAMAFATAFWKAQINNIIYTATSVGPHRFYSNMKVGELFKLYLTNTLGIIFSLGLLIPWAKVRLVRYWAEHFKLDAAGSLDDFVSDTSTKVGSAGQEVGEIFDVDIGI